MTREGRVVRRPFATGSKSERQAIMLETEDGEFLLRRLGGNPLFDPDLAALVGQVVRAHGVLHGGSLILRDWDVL